MPQAIEWLIVILVTALAFMTMRVMWEQRESRSYQQLYSACIADMTQWKAEAATQQQKEDEAAKEAAEQMQQEQNEINDILQSKDVPTTCYGAMTWAIKEAQAI